MTSYLSSLTSHYNSIKRLLPTHLSPDADNSINDPADSHVSRVLRAYYTEKGRPFPSWLGPDPNAPVRAQPNYLSQARPSSSSMRAGVGPVKKGGGLGDLFGDSNATQSPPLQEEPLSLRSRRGAFKAQTPSASSQSGPIPQPTARPLPSQREGSYQSRSSDSGGNGFSVPAIKEQTAQERLRARLGGSKGSSPAPTPSPNANFDSRSNGRNGSGFDPYDSRGAYNPYESGGSNGNFNPYENSGAGGGFNPYETGSKNPYISSGSNQRPYAGSNSPWSMGDDGADLGSGNGRRGPGLPTNPKGRR